MRRTRTIQIAAIAWTMVFADAALSVPKQDLTFYLAFEDEDSNDAQIAAGNPRCRTPSGSLTFVPGREGKGILLFGKNPRLVYEAAGNLDLTAGTAALWFKPRDWGKGERCLRQYWRQWNNMRFGYLVARDDIMDYIKKVERKSPPHP